MFLLQAPRSKNPPEPNPETARKTLPAWSSELAAVPGSVAFYDRPYNVVRPHQALGYLAAELIPTKEMKSVTLWWTSRQSLNLADSATTDEYEWLPFLGVWGNIPNPVPKVTGTSA